MDIMVIVLLIFMGYCLGSIRRLWLVKRAINRLNPEDSNERFYAMKEIIDIVISRV